MHSSIQITNEVYRKPSDSDIHSRVRQLRRSEARDAGDSGGVFRLFQQFLESDRAENAKPTTHGAQD